MGAGRQGSIRLGGQHQNLNGRGQHAEADACRQSQQGQQAEGGGNGAVRLPGIIPGQRRRRKGQQAHGDRIDKGRHHVGHDHAGGILAVQGVGLCQRQAQTILQAAQNDFRIHQRDDAHGGISQSNGHTDGQNPPHQPPTAGGDVQRTAPVPVGSQIAG